MNLTKAMYHKYWQSRVHCVPSGVYLTKIEIFIDNADQTHCEECGVLSRGNILSRSMTGLGYQMILRFGVDLSWTMKQTTKCLCWWFMGKLWHGIDLIRSYRPSKAGNSRLRFTTQAMRGRPERKPFHGCVVYNTGNLSVNPHPLGIVGDLF